MVRGDGAGVPAAGRDRDRVRDTGDALGKDGAAQVAVAELSMVVGTPAPHDSPHLEAASVGHPGSERGQAWDGHLSRHAVLSEASVAELAIPVVAPAAHLAVPGQR